MYTLCLCFIYTLLDNDQFVWGVFMNLQKTFDTIDHKIPLSKMNHYWTKSIPYGWFKSYLTNTTVYNS